MVQAVRRPSPVPDLAPARALRNRDRDRRLMDVQPDEPITLHAASPPFLSLGAS